MSFHAELSLLTILNLLKNYFILFVCVCALTHGLHLWVSDKTMVGVRLLAGVTGSFKLSGVGAGS